MSSVHMRLKRPPEWELLGLPGVDELPGVRWKLINIKKMSPEKLKEMTAKLEKKLL